MATGSHALVLMGDLLPGFAPDTAWPQLAAYFHMAPEKLAQLMESAPRVVRHSDDVEQLQRLQAAITQIGAAAEICRIDDRPALHVQIEGTPRGPVPWSLVQQCVQQRRWPSDIRVVEVGMGQWKPYRDLDPMIGELIPLTTIPVAAPAAEPPPAPAAARAASPFSSPLVAPAPAFGSEPAFAPEPSPVPVPPPPPFAPTAVAPAAPAPRTAPDDNEPALAGLRYRAAGKSVEMPDVEEMEPAKVGNWTELPGGRSGKAVHAGFWRRCAAYIIDSLIWLGISLAFLLLLVIIAISFGASAALSGLTHGGGDAAAFASLGGGIVFVAVLFTILIIGLAFWYYPWKESSEVQATFGERAMGIKVVDVHGERISLLRSVWRYLSMLLVVFILSLIVAAVVFVTEPELRGSRQLSTGASITINLVIALTFMLAGWTRRKQTLYDMLSGTYVVFDEVEPGRTLPWQRPPMPWYGWALIIIFGVLPALSSLGTGLVWLSHYGEGSAQEKTTAIITSAESLANEIEQQGCQPGSRPPPDPLVEKVDIDSVGTRGCQITMTLAHSSDLPKPARGEMIRLKSVEGRGDWECTSTMPDRYLPKGCRANDNDGS